MAGRRSSSLRNLLSVGVAFAATTAVLGLAACGSSGTDFSAGATVTSTSTLTSTGTSTATVTSTSTSTSTTTTTATSAKATGAIAGLTVANQALLPDGSNTLATVSVLSNAASSAPVQVGLGSNGNVLAASVGTGGATGPVVSPLVSAVQGLTGTLQNGGLSAVTGKLDAVSANSPLGQLLNLNLGNVQVLGASGKTAALNLGVASGNQLLTLLIAPPAGVPNPLTGLIGPVSRGAGALNGALAASPIGSVLGTLTATGVQGSTALNTGLLGVTAPLGKVVSAVTAPLATPVSLGGGLGGGLAGGLGNLGGLTSALKLP